MSSLRVSICDSSLRITEPEFQQKISLVFNETLSSLSDIWKNAGYEDLECQGLLGELYTKMKKLCLNEIDAEKQILNHAELTVSNKFNDLCTQYKKLGRKSPTNDSEFGKNLTDKLANLEKQLIIINKEVNERQSLLDVELKAIYELCDKLGEEYPEMSRFSGPLGTHEFSDVRLKLLKEFRLELANEIPRRMEIIKILATECHSVQNDLELEEEGFATVPNSEKYLSLDENIMEFGKTGELLFNLKNEQVSLLKLRLNLLNEEKEKRREELAITGQDIARLWTLLKIPSEERANFSTSFKMNLSMKTLAVGKSELDRLKKLQIKSMGKIISQIRSEIESLWDELAISTVEQRECEFSQFYISIEDLTEKSIEDHESYLNSLKARLEELKPLLTKITKREAIVAERIELEHIQLNPERLTARGPKAREDRKREEGITNRVKNLEKLTKEILVLIGQWEEKHGEFRYLGESYTSRVSAQDESYFEIRDSLRNARRKKDGKPEVKLPVRKGSIISGQNSKTLSSSYEFNTNNATKGNNSSVFNDIENLNANQRNSVDSDLTEYTSLTEIKK
jgi:hypothetical protein